MRNGESTLADRRVLATQFEENLNRIERNGFSNTMYILTKWINVYVINIDQLKLLNVPVAKILTVHTDSNEAIKADSDIAHSLKAKLLLARNAHIMLITNL